MRIKRRAVRGCSAAQQIFEEPLYTGEDFRSLAGIVDSFAQGCAVRYAVGEPGDKLLHLAPGPMHLLIDQHLEVGADHLVTIGVGGLIVASALDELADLAED